MAAPFNIVCGHHVYKAMWSPYVGEELLVECKINNIQDDFAVAIMKNGMIIGHVPQESVGTSTEE